VSEAFDAPQVPLSADAVEALLQIVRDAGAEILRYYGAPGAVVEKEDRTPLTAADRAAHTLIVRELGRLTPDIPVLSEESEPDELEGREGWGRFWLVDPLDGTKEFLKRTGEFTVNVALIEAGVPTLGVVYVPALGVTYLGSEALGAQKSEGGGPFRSIRTRPFSTDPQAEPVLVASRDHAGPGVAALASALGERVRFTSMGSSLKFCLVAEGVADLYLRDLPTMEWDTGAAHAVLRHAGGEVYGVEGAGQPAPLRYNTPTLRNPHFLAVGDPSGPWRSLYQESRTHG